MKNFSLLEEKIGVMFKNKDLLSQAFTHRSYINEYRAKKLEHNERLEFLGDAVLELVVTEYLYAKYPERPEGDLTSFRAALVNTNTLSEVTDELGFNEFLLLSKGESKDVGRARQYILANTFEAFVGALYLDQGYDAAKKFISANLFSLIDNIVSKRLWQDSKSYFQEQAQEHVNITPEYHVSREEGPDHDKHFTIGVYLGKELVAEGDGKSKQEAEQSAAEEALFKKGWKK
jgi:ribonuclease-3